MARAICLLALLLVARVQAQPDDPGGAISFGPMFPLNDLSQFTEVGLFAGAQFPVIDNPTFTPSVRFDAYYFPSDYELIAAHNPAAFLLQLQSDLHLPGDADVVYLLGSAGGALTYSATTANDWRGGIIGAAGIGIDFDIGRRGAFLEGRFIYTWIDRADDWKFIPVGFGLRF